MSGDFKEWLLANCEVKSQGHSSACWLWRGTLNHNGYPVGYVPGVTYKCRIHRAAYQRIVGPVEPSLQIDHLCRVRHCVNPTHLEPVSAAENIRRGLTGEVAGARMLAKTHCPQGHEYTEDNTYRWGARRYCRACRSGHRSMTTPSSNVSRRVG